MPLRDVTNAAPRKRRRSAGSGDSNGKRRRSARLGGSQDNQLQSSSPRSSASPFTPSPPLHPAFDLAAPVLEQLEWLTNDVRRELQDPSFQPLEWQLHAALLLLHGWDGIVGAATGSGKSLIWELVALAAPSSTILVVCPLVALEADQVARFKSSGSSLRAVSLSQVASEALPTPARATSTGLRATESRRDHISTSLVTRHANIVFGSLESVLHNKSVQDVLGSARFRKRLMAIIVDEAHIVETWGLTPSARTALPFRPAFSEIQTLRARLGAHLPALAVSATFARTTTKSVLGLLGFGSRNTFVFDAGVDRANIAYTLLPMRHPSSSFMDLLQLFSVPTSTPDGIPKTVIYTRTRAMAYDIADKLSEHFAKWGPSFRSIVRPFTALCSAAYKEQILRFGFCAGGPIRVLVSTEAGGLGIDVPDIAFVIQHDLPNTALEAAQHFGRAVRNRTLTGHSLLIAPSWSVSDPAVVQTPRNCTRREQLGSDLRVTDMAVCMRKALENEIQLDLETVEQALPALPRVTFSLGDIEERLGNTAKGPESIDLVLVTATYAQPSSARATFCCSSRSCAGPVHHHPFPLTLPSRQAQISGPSSSSDDAPASTPARRGARRAPAAHPGLVPAQMHFSSRLRSWARSVHASANVPAYISSTCLLAPRLVERIVAHSTRFLAIFRDRGAAAINEQCVEDLIGPSAASSIFPGCGPSLAAAVSDACVTFDA